MERKKETKKTERRKRHNETALKLPELLAKVESNRSLHNTECLHAMTDTRCLVPVTKKPRYRIMGTGVLEKRSMTGVANASRINPAPNRLNMYHRNGSAQANFMLITKANSQCRRRAPSLSKERREDGERNPRTRDTKTDGSNGL
jgi:hypothetical protein